VRFLYVDKEKGIKYSYGADDKIPNGKVREINKTSFNSLRYIVPGKIIIR